MHASKTKEIEAIKIHLSNVEIVAGMHKGKFVLEVAP
jgi:hypothetical protein